MPQTFKIDFKDPKFTTKHIDVFADQVYKILKNSDQNDLLLFDLSTLEWIAHEEIVYVSALFFHLKELDKKFYLKFRTKAQVTERQAAQFVNLWDTWAIHSFVEPNSQGFYDYGRYMDIDESYIKHLKAHVLLNYKPTKADINNLNKITPFIPINIDPKFSNEEQISETLEQIYNLDLATLSLLDKYQTRTPFLNHTLSSIITKELFENSIDHAYLEKDDGAKLCYFGLSLKNKLPERDFNLEYVNGLNFNQEELAESINFFKDENGFKNQSFLQFTFLDFGRGIPTTLKKAYLDYTQIEIEDFDPQLDSSVLEYAFGYHSSRSTIAEKFKNRFSVPRGLYDLIHIVQKYKGLIVVRSNYGKIFYDYSDPNQFPDGVCKRFNNDDLFFPGTIISIYIPENENGIDFVPGKPKFNLTGISRDAEYINILQIQKRIAPEIKDISNPQKKKEELYLRTFNEMDKVLDKFIGKKTTLYIDFAGCKFEERPIKYILYYLASTPKINQSVNAIIVNPPDKDLVANIRDTIINYKSDANKFIYHAIPCIYGDLNSQELEVVWIGIRSEFDESTFTKSLLYTVNDQRAADFVKPEGVEGNLFSLDSLGNLQRHVPHLSALALNSVLFQNTIKEQNTVFLSAGSHYQYEYLSFLEMLQDDKYSLYFVTHLLNQVTSTFINEVEVLICITLSSQLLGRVLKDEIFKKFNKKMDLIRLSNYHSFDKERPFEILSAGRNAVLVCDVIATGNLIKHVKRELDKKSILLKGVISLVDSRKVITDSFQKDEIIPNSEGIEDVKIITLIERKISKFSSNVHSAQKVVRINPITNGPNTLSIDKSEIDKIIIKDNQSFLNKLFDLKLNFLKVGNFEQNNVQHLYWVEIGRLLTNKYGLEVLHSLVTDLKRIEKERFSSDRMESKNYLISQIKRDLEKTRKADKNADKNDLIYSQITNDLESVEGHLNKLDPIEEFQNPDIIFYPIYSGVEQISKYQYKNDIFEDFNLEIIPIARINTPKGWRFTFPPKFLNKLSKDKNVLILDAGSITGDTIFQLISEICYLDVKRITVLSIIGRVEDFQREFLSRLKEMKVKRFDINDDFLEMEINTSEEHSIPVHVYFGVHFHIPTYGQTTLNPLWHEKEHLSKLMEITNIPPSVKRYILKRNEQLTPLMVDQIQTYVAPDYLPEDRNTTQVPVNELFHYRDQIGKISGYRFFNEYFKFFEDILNYYKDDTNRKKSIKDRYKRIELLMAVLIHEPNLIQVIKDLVPDLHIRLKVFIDLIVVKKELSLEMLYYKWERYPLLVFLIMLKKDDLFYNSSDINSLFHAIKFAERDFGNNSLDYISFALFDELTHFGKDTGKGIKNDTIYNRIIQLEPYKTALDERTIRVLDKLEAYCNTNPFSELEGGVKFFSQNLRKIYSNEKVNGKYHGGVETSLDLIISQHIALDLATTTNKEDRALQIINYEWKQTVLPTLQVILKNAKGLDEILKSYNNGKLYNLIEGNTFSLQSGIENFDELLYTKQINNKISESREIVKYFMEKIISQSSDCLQFFKNYKCDLLEQYRDFGLNLLDLKGYRYDEDIDPDLKNIFVDIHQEIWTKVFLEPLMYNIDNHSDKEGTKFVWKSSLTHFIFRVECCKKEISNLDKDNVDLHLKNKRTGIETMKRVGQYYEIEVRHSDYEKSSNIFFTEISFPKSK